MRENFKFSASARKLDLRETALRENQIRDKKDAQNLNSKIKWIKVYEQENTELIRRAITDFNWDRAFLNTNVNEKVSIFSNTILNILSNFIPYETLVCGDKDPP